MDSLSDLLKKPQSDFKKDLMDRHKYVSKEYQDYGYRIAVKLDDAKRASMYIKLAKEQPRAFLEQAFSFAIDYPKAKNRGRLFMWKLKQLREEMVVQKQKTQPT
jgi:hypothetical protein